MSLAVDDFGLGRVAARCGRAWPLRVSSAVAALLCLLPQARFRGSPSPLTSDGEGSGQAARQSAAVGPAASRSFRPFSFLGARSDPLACATHALKGVSQYLLLCNQFEERLRDTYLTHTTHSGQLVTHTITTFPTHLTHRESNTDWS